MHLKERLLKKVQLLAALFILLILIVTGAFYSFNASVENVLEQTHPALQTVTHMETDLLADSVLVLRYLSTDNSETLLALDKENQERNTVCSSVKISLDTLIESGVINDQKIVEQYRHARTEHAKTEHLKEKVLELHREEVLAEKDNSNLIDEQFEEYLTSFDETKDALREVSNLISLRNEELQRTYAFQTKIYLGSLIVLSLLFIFLLFVTLNGVWRGLVTPLHELSEKTKSFVDGNYKEHIDLNSEVHEIEELEQNINSIFSAVDTISKNPKQKQQVQKELLRSDLKDILDMLSLRESQKLSTTIKDVKRQLRITHPTAIQRIRELESKGLLYLEKQGREKHIILR